MENLRIATAIFSSLLIVQVVRAVRREHIRVEYSMAWFGCALLLLGLSISDKALGWIQALLGIEGFALVLLIIAGILFLFTFFRFSIVVSGLKDHNIVLAQKVGMLEWEIKRQAEEIERLRAKDAAGPQSGAGT
jgi:hypothetical protein